MFDDLEPQKQTTNSITLGTDLSTFSVEDIDELITRLKDENCASWKKKRVRKDN